ncbi:MAG: dehydrogenase, partial [Sphingobacterium sp.]
MNKFKLQQQRRDFLKTSAMIAGGTMLSSIPLMGHSSVNDTIKIALVGCGGRGTGAATQALSTKFNLQLVAMADAFKDRLDESYKDLSEKFKDKVNIPEEHKFVGFDAYAKAIALA